MTTGIRRFCIFSAPLMVFVMMLLPVRPFAHAYDIENHLGVYRVVQAECKLNRGLYNPCPDIRFLELVKGGFEGIEAGELALVHWRAAAGESTLLYEARLIRNHHNLCMKKNKIWLIDRSTPEEEEKESFLLQNGRIDGYRYHYTRKNRAGRIIRRNFYYRLSPTSRDEIEEYALPYPEGTAENTETVDILQTISFRDAGISLDLPAHWEFHSPDTVLGPQCSLSVSIESRNTTVSLADFVCKVNAYKAKLARTVKQDQYHTLVRRAKFQTLHGNKGIKCVYGYSAEAPSAISYFLLKSPRQAVTLNLKFHTWDTGAIWTGTDKIITTGIRCRQKRN